MTGMQLWTVAMAALSLVVVMLRLDGMTWRTHPWRAVVRTMACGLVSCGCLWAGWVDEAVPLAIALQILVLADLAATADLHAAAWRPSKLQEIRGDGHAQ